MSSAPIENEPEEEEEEEEKRLKVSVETARKKHSLSHDHAILRHQLFGLYICFCKQQTTGRMIKELINFGRTTVVHHTQVTSATATAARVWLISSVVVLNY